MAGTDIQGTGRKKLRWQLTLIILAMGVLKFLINLIVWGNYELHREAYLTMMYAQNPAWGYIENPPFIMWMSWISSSVFGGSTFALRFFPALAGGITMILIGRLTKELGGRKWAVLLATTAYLVAPVFLKSNSLFLPSAFTEYFWFTYLYLFVKLLQTQNRNYWFVLGFVAGLGFLSSYTIFIPVVLTTLFLFATRHRHLLLCPQITGFLFNLAIFSIPNLIWQYNHNWPEFKNLRELSATQLVNLDSAWFVAMQFVMLAPVIFIWVIGLYNLFASKESRPFIVLAYSFITMIILMLVMHAKPFYPAPFYMVLVVFGAIQWEMWLEKNYRNVLIGLMVIMIAATIPLLPLSLPYLKVEKLAAFGDKWQKRGLEAPFMWEDGTLHRIPQDYADMVGWKDFTATVNDLIVSNPDSANLVVFVLDKDLAAAFNFYNRRNKSLPRAISLDGSFAMWSPDSIGNPSRILVIGEPDSLFIKNAISINLLRKFEHPYARINGMPVYEAVINTSSFDDAYQDERRKARNKYLRKKD